eukprot:1636190-Pyramimonas_sp.AAC.2
MPRCTPAALVRVGRLTQTTGVRPWTAQQRSGPAMGRPSRRRSRVSRAERLRRETWWVSEEHLQ